MLTNCLCVSRFDSAASSSASEESGSEEKPKKKKEIKRKAEKPRKESSAKKPRKVASNDSFVFLVEVTKFLSSDAYSLAVFLAQMAECVCDFISKAWIFPVEWSFVVLDSSWQTLMDCILIWIALNSSRFIIY